MRIVGWSALFWLQFGIAQQCGKPKQISPVIRQPIFKLTSDAAA
jgi:hypothetical protein